MNISDRNLLYEALLDAFPSRDALERMLWLKLGWRLEEIAGAEPLTTTVIRLLQHAEATGAEKAVIQAAHTSNPSNALLGDAYRSVIGSAPTEQPATGGRPQATGSPAKLSRPLKLVYHQSPRDQRFGNELEKHLTRLLKNGLIERPWNATMIPPGSNWRAEIQRHFGEADLILLLVSADLLAEGDEYIDLAEARHKAGATVVPIVVRPASWQGSWFDELQAYPSDGGVVKPINRWSDESEAWLNVLDGLKMAIAARGAG